MAKHETNFFSKMTETNNHFSINKNNYNYFWDSNRTTTGIVDSNNTATTTVQKEKFTFVESPFTLIMDDVEKRNDDTSLLKSSFITYSIKFLRTSDSEVHYVWKRFREISNWFNEVISVFCEF